MKAANPLRRAIALAALAWVAVPAQAMACTAGSSVARLASADVCAVASGCSEELMPATDADTLPSDEFRAPTLALRPDSPVTSVPRRASSVATETLTPATAAVSAAADVLADATAELTSDADGSAAIELEMAVSVDAMRGRFTADCTVCEGKAGGDNNGEGTRGLAARPEQGAKSASAAARAPS